jgi:hypothetical protein
MAALCPAKGGEYVAYRWKGKGSNVHPRNVQRAGPLTKVTTVPVSGGSFAGEGFSCPFQGGSGRTAAAVQGDLLWCIQSIRVGGRLSGVTGG